MKIILTLLLLISLKIVISDLPGCQTYQENQCSGSDVTTPDYFENHRWFTPGKGEDGYQESFQDYSRLVGHVHLEYASDLKSVTVQVIALHKDNQITLSYTFDGVQQSSSSKQYDSSYTGILKVSIQGSDGSNLNLEDVDFVWNAPKINLASGDYRNGQKGAIVELFGWPHSEIEKECQTLSKSGYLGVKVFPAQEQVISQQPFNNMLNPWYFMYQPVSYRLQGRMGTRDELRSLIQTCRKYNVRVYADAVINHMVGGGNDANPDHRNQAGSSCQYFPNKNSSLQNGSSPFYTQNYVYKNSSVTGFPPSQEFPAVPYGPTDFHCQRALNSWTDPTNLNAGWLTGLTDLNTEKSNVQERIADYLTDLLSIGFSGFRIDAAKHIKPEDLTGIFTKLQRNMGGKLPDDFISWLEVLLGGESDLLMCDSSSTYNYGIGLQNLLLKAGMSQTDVDKIKVWNSGYPKEPEKGFCNIDRKRNAIQNDDADQQTPGSTSRDMSSQGCVLIINCNSADDHRNYELQLFNNPPGAQDNSNDYPIRLILSSFYYPNNTALGIPDGKSDCSNCLIDCQNCQGVSYKQAYNAQSTGYDGSKGVVEYSRVHRDIQIVNAMRKWMGLSSINYSEFIENYQSTDIGFLTKVEK